MFDRQSETGLCMKINCFCIRRFYFDKQLHLGMSLHSILKNLIENNVGKHTESEKKVLGYILVVYFRIWTFHLTGHTKIFFRAFRQFIFPQTNLFYSMMQYKLFLTQELKVMNAQKIKILKYFSSCLMICSRWIMHSNVSQEINKSTRLDIDLR